MNPTRIIVLGLVGGILLQSQVPPVCAQETPTQAEGAAAPAPLTPPPAASAPPQKSAIPKAFGRDRYASLVEKSPFAIATAPVEVVAPVENFATNWVLTGLSKKRGKEGEPVYTAFVKSKDLSTRLVITGDQPTEDVYLVSVDEAPVAYKSSVILKRGGETGRVEFDQATVAASAPATPGVPPGAKPGGVQGVPAVRPSSSSVKPTVVPRPGLQGSVPRPGASQAQPVPSAAVPPQTATPPATQGSQDARRRVRPISEP